MYLLKPTDLLYPKIVDGAPFAIAPGVKFYLDLAFKFQFECARVRLRIEDNGKVFKMEYRELIDRSIWDVSGKIKKVREIEEWFAELFEATISFPENGTRGYITIQLDPSFYREDCMVPTHIFEKTCSTAVAA